MDFTIFILAAFSVLVLLWLGYSRRAFGLAYLAMGLAIIFGLVLMSDGLDLQTGHTIIENPTTGDFNISETYTTHTVDNDFFINSVAMILFYGGFIGIFLTTFLALRG